jgi:hypothetical protein
MGKAVTIFLGLAMIAHLIRPFGLPGLKKRSDAWKIALFALFAMVVLVGIRPN